MLVGIWFSRGLVVFWVVVIEVCFQYESFRMELLGAWDPPGQSMPCTRLCGSGIPILSFYQRQNFRRKQWKEQRGKWGFFYGLVVPKSNKSGGLAMLWKENINLEIMGYAGNFIDTMVARKPIREKNHGTN